MRLPALVIALAACGGSSKPAESPRPPEPKLEPAPAPTVNVYGDASLLREAPPPPPRPVEVPQPPKPPIYDRLLDTDGDVAGLTGFSTKRVRNTSRCGGQAILTKRGKKVAPTDVKLVEVFALEFPLDLNFTDEKKQAASRLKFERFVETLTKTLAAARTQYEAEFASTAPAVKAAATARLAQIYLRAASVLARAEVPIDIRTGDATDEATTVYCDAMAEQAERMIQLGSDALGACRRFTLAAPAGWWAELCKAP